MKRILVTSTNLMMRQFLVPHIQQLLRDGWHVELACSHVGGRFEELQEIFLGNLKIHKVHLHRSPARIDNLIGLRQLMKIIQDGHFDLIWTNEPVMSVITRIAAKPARKHGTKVLYMSHGFHFCKGAPIKNWLIFYPIERLMSRYTDVLVTINHEDYKRAKGFKVKKVYYMPGIGVDITKFSPYKKNRREKRDELGLCQDDYILLSVGELSQRKNHKVVLEALAHMKDHPQFTRIKYLICGVGPLEGKLKKMIYSLDLIGHVFILGFRRDISELCNCSDLFLFPSLQEGLPVALMEAMACGLPIICSNIRGNTDMIEDGVNGCVVSNLAYEYKYAIDKMISSKDLSLNFASASREKIQLYDIEEIKNLLKEIHTDEMSFESPKSQNIREPILKGLSRIYLRQKQRRKYNIPENSFVLLSVGEINWRKNHETIIHALKWLIDLPIYYVICGNGELMDRHKNLAKNLGIADRLIFTGYLRNIQDIYCIADLFIFPSRIEGMGLAAIEAMTAGIPIITSNVHGINDYSINGVTGYQCKANDSKTFARYIRYLIEDRCLREKMSRYNLEATEKYGLNNAISLMRRILQISQEEYILEEDCYEFK